MLHVGVNVKECNKMRAIDRFLFLSCTYYCELKCEWLSKDPFLGLVTMHEPIKHICHQIYNQEHTRVVDVLLGLLFTCQAVFVCPFSHITPHPARISVRPWWALLNLCAQVFRMTMNASLS